MHSCILRSPILRSPDPSARWNFVAGPALATLRFDASGGRAVARRADGEVLFESGDPFAALDWMAALDLTDTPDARWIGFIGYEFAREIERLPATACGESKLPTFQFVLCDAESEREPPRPDRAGDGRALIPPARVAPIRLVDRSFSRDAYLAAARRALDLIAAGDVFQVNLAQRFSFKTDRSARMIFDALTRDSPSPYGACLELEGSPAIVSNSPELFFRIEPQPDGSRRIVNRPIKGTRPRGPGMYDALAASAKDRAELAMIVDLQRNDLGRVCEIGSVAVREARVIETHPTVYHGVATIDGRLRVDATFADVVRALFPCGSITGCPKVRAMEIIDELEPVARGPYCGAIGYLDAHGGIEFNVAIRTMVVDDGVAHVYVGGGIVADSSPAEEYEETLVKARAMLDALGVDERSRAALRAARHPAAL